MKFCLLYLVDILKKSYIAMIPFRGKISFCFMSGISMLIIPYVYLANNNVQRRGISK